MAEGRMRGRIQRPNWRDPRLGVGVLLVAGSVALGTWAVNQADRTIEVYAASGLLTPGAVLEEQDLQVVRVHVADMQELYLRPGDGPGDGAVAVRTVGEGELVPVSAVGRAEDLALRPVSIPTGAAAAATLTAGALADIWVALPGEAGPTAPLQAPQLLIGDVQVAAIHEDTSLFAGSDQEQVQVLVPVEDLSEVLAALSSGGEITIVPQPGGTG
ncbi:MAG TPA: hypothetical protein VK095_16155 [Beutenbergiaceae bacterium]|nr:hypothetical protein [Beutenbergiaceae bacterium]